MMDFRRLLYVFSFVAVLANLAVPANADFTCGNFIAVNVAADAKGSTELVGDIVFTCSGGTPTAAGNAVPQVNITVSANTNITSRILATIVGGVTTSFNEALLIIDQPNTSVYNHVGGRPLSNCGYDGEDVGPSGPGVCAIISDGIPADTYDGSSNTYAGGTCDGTAGRPVAESYGCGRPNVFQGRNAVSLISGQANAIVFAAVPFDPPSSVSTRNIRITNIRVDATRFGVSSPFTTVPVTATVSFASSTSISVPDTTVTVAEVQQGMTTSSLKGVKNIRVQENFPSAWKVKNLAGTLANGTFNGFQYAYNGTTISPISDDAQNVPGATYFTESGFENSPLAIVPVPNPPLGFGESVFDVGRSFLSPNGTGLESAGIVSHGTLIAVKVPGGLVPPQVVPLRNQSNNQQTGVMVLVEGSNSAAKHVAEYEILFSDPFAREYADIILAVPSHLRATGWMHRDRGSASALRDASAGRPYTSANRSGERY